MINDNNKDNNYSNDNDNNNNILIIRIQFNSMQFSLFLLTNEKVGHAEHDNLTPPPGI